jgi:hypothetical protein
MIELDIVEISEKLDVINANGLDADRASWCENVVSVRTLTLGTQNDSAGLPADCE